jgi:hypothetical protein
VKEEASNKNGFIREAKRTVKTVLGLWQVFSTSLKRGVNRKEKEIMKKETTTQIFIPPNSRELKIKQE